MYNSPVVWLLAQAPSIPERELFFFNYGIASYCVTWALTHHDNLPPVILTHSLMLYTGDDGQRP